MCTLNILVLSRSFHGYRTALANLLEIIKISHRNMNKTLFVSCFMKLFYKSSMEECKGRNDKEITLSPFLRVRLMKNR